MIILSCLIGKDLIIIYTILYEIRPAFDLFICSGISHFFSLPNSAFSFYMPV